MLVWLLFRLGVEQRADEIGLLLSAFNGMLAEIQSRDMELQRHRDGLEEQIASRTADLCSMNKELLTAKEVAERASHDRGR